MIEKRQTGNKENKGGVGRFGEEGWYRRMVCC